MQVLQEDFVATTPSLTKLQVDARAARRKNELLAESGVVESQVAHILAAVDLHRLHGLFFWDALA
jgi:hypothetical protein